MKTATFIPTVHLRDVGDDENFIISHNLCDEKRAHVNIPHKHSNYTIDLLLEGEITHHVDFDRHTVKAPAIILIAPGQVHMHESQSDYQLISISFSKEYIVHELDSMLSCWECLFSNGAINVNDEQMKELLQYARMMSEEYRNKKLKRGLVIKNLLSAFVICITRTLRSKTNMEYMDPGLNNMVRAFTDLVNRHFFEKTQVAGYAEMLYVTPGHLNDTIKAATGKTAKQIIDDRRIMEAKRLLFWGNHSVKEIAWELNFEDDGYFNRFFKKHTGSTPALFQRGILKKYN